MISFKHSKRTGARGKKRKPDKAALAAADLFNTPVAPVANPAKKARDDALAQVAENASARFMQRALSAISQIRGEVTGEDIRTRLLELGITPHHHNAWGAVISVAVKKHILLDTGRFVHMKTEKSHARKTTLYRVNNG